MSDSRSTGAGEPDISVVPAAIQLPAPLVLVYKGYQSGEGVRHGAGRRSRTRVDGKSPKGRPQEGRLIPFGRRPGVAAGRYSERSRFWPRRRLKVSRSIARTCRRCSRIRAEPPPASPTATTNPTAMTQNRGTFAIRRRSLLSRR